MAETTTITVRVPVELKEKLDRLAEATQRSRSFLAAEALEIYTRYELEIVEGILESIEDFEAGRYFTHEQMVEATEQMISESAAGHSERRKKAAAS